MRSSLTRASPRRRSTTTSRPRTTSSSRSSRSASVAGRTTGSPGRRGSGAQPAEEQLLAIFDLFGEWFRRKDFEGCSFINVLLEMSSDHPAGRASVRHLENIRGVVAELAAEADLRDPGEFARSWHILMKGSIVQAAEGDVDAARRAQALARLLIAEHRREPAA
jgi:hypothetical protein